MEATMFLSKSSSGIWQLYYNNTLGKRTKVSTKTKNKSAALAFLKTFNLDRQPINKNTRFVEFVKDFNQYTQSNYAQGNKDLYERAFRNFQLIFGNITLRSITPLHWEKYKISRLQNRAPVTVNIELRCMKAALNVAKQWNLIESNPFSSLKQCPVVEKSPSFFSKANLRLLVNSIKVQWLKEIVLFAVLTGMREGEILHLRWQNIDFERKMIAIQLTCPRFMCQ
jgi:integrase